MGPQPVLRLDLALPASLRGLFEALREAGGRPYLVGGAVRDRLLGLPVKDYDVETFALPAERLRAVLSDLGRLDEVGQAFTVFKVSGLVNVEGQVDVALPRRDSKAGPGHRGIAAHGDPAMSTEEAARRRDFTINALLADPFSGEVIDCVGGLADLGARVLRAVDSETFGEDPLRALRAVQMAARYGLTVDPVTARLCAAMPLGELPPERIFGEMEKLLLKAPRPSVGLDLMRRWGMLPHVAPELAPLSDTPQDPAWHPEGDVWTHTLQVVDDAAQLLLGLDHARRLAVMLGALCHDLGKPATTAHEDGRIRSRGHEEAGVAPAMALLDRWRIWTVDGYDVRRQVLAFVAHHLKPGELFKARAQVGDGAIRRLARKCEPELLARVAEADCTGRRPGRFEPVAMEWFRERLRELDVGRRPPDPLLRGRDILALGLLPGPEVGRILQELYEMQLDGTVSTREQALDEARRILG